MRPPLESCPTSPGESRALDAVGEPFRRRHIELRNGDDDGETVKRDVVLRSLAYSRGMKIGAIPTPKVWSGNQ